MGLFFFFCCSCRFSIFVTLIKGGFLRTCLFSPPPLPSFCFLGCHFTGFEFCARSNLIRFSFFPVRVTYCLKLCCGAWGFGLHTPPSPPRTPPPSLHFFLCPHFRLLSFTFPVCPGASSAQVFRFLFFFFFLCWYFVAFLYSFDFLFFLLLFSVFFRFFLLFFPHSKLLPSAPTWLSRFVVVGCLSHAPCLPCSLLAFDVLSCVPGVCCAGFLLPTGDLSGCFLFGVSTYFVFYRRGGGVLFLGVCVLFLFSHSFVLKSALTSGLDLPPPPTHRAVVLVSLCPPFCAFFAYLVSPQDCFFFVKLCYFLSCYPPLFGYVCPLFIFAPGVGVAFWGLFLFFFFVTPSISSYLLCFHFVQRFCCCILRLIRFFFFFLCFILGSRIDLLFWSWNRTAAQFFLLSPSFVYVWFCGYRSVVCVSCDFLFGVAFLVVLFLFSLTGVFYGFYSWYAGFNGLWFLTVVSRFVFYFVFFVVRPCLLFDFFLFAHIVSSAFF